LPEDYQKSYYDEIWFLGKEQNNGLLSNLEIIEVNKQKVIFKLSITNKTQNDLYFFISGDIYKHFRFRKINEFKVELGGIPMLYSGKNNGNIINKCEKLEFKIEFHNNIFNIKNNDNEDNYFNAEIDLEIGKYETYCGISVDKNFFCPVSHLKYKDIRKISKENNLKLWKGNIITNKVIFEI
jgi:hypothetical protein